MCNIPLCIEHLIEKYPLRLLGNTAVIHNYIAANYCINGFTRQLFSIKGRGFGAAVQFLFPYGIFAFKVNNSEICIGTHLDTALSGI